MSIRELGTLLRSLLGEKHPRRKREKTHKTLVSPAQTAEQSGSVRFLATLYRNQANPHLLPRATFVLAASATVECLEMPAGEWQEDGDVVESTTVPQLFLSLRDAVAEQFASSSEVPRSSPSSISHEAAASESPFRGLLGALQDAIASSSSNYPSLIGSPASDNVTTASGGNLLFASNTNASTLLGASSLYASVSLESLMSVNVSGPSTLDDEILGPIRDPLSTVIPMTIVYSLILVTGLIGNVCTCTVIARNKYMHTTVNYYLFSLAVSDLLLLITGLPQELWMLWQKYPYVFGETFCVLRALTSETCTNASVLTITAFTVERYIAICYPLKAHTMAQLPRAIKAILVIWAVAAISSVPIALQLGIIYQVKRVQHEPASCCCPASLIGPA